MHDCNKTSVSPSVNKSLFCLRGPSVCTYTEWNFVFFAFVNFWLRWLGTTFRNPESWIDMNKTSLLKLIHGLTGESLDDPRPTTIHIWSIVAPCLGWIDAAVCCIFPGKASSRNTWIHEWHGLIDHRGSWIARAHVSHGLMNCFDLHTWLIPTSVVWYIVVEKEHSGKVESLQSKWC